MSDSGDYALMRSIDGTDNDEVSMIAAIRKIVVQVDEIHSEMGRAVEPVTRRAVAMAVIANPYAGRFSENLDTLTTIGEELGGLLGAKCVEALGIKPEQAQSYGKAAIVGEGGELEHAAALLHPKMGATLRQAVSRGAALVPSAKKMGGLGTAIDVPLGHKDAAFVRSHFDAIEARVSDAPRANEIVVAIAVTDSGRPLPRVGGLQTSEIKGQDGLR
jgi:Amino acid synthesis